MEAPNLLEENMKRTTRIAALTTAASAIAIAGVVGVVTGASADTAVNPAVATTADASDAATCPNRPDADTIPYVGVHLRRTADGLVVRSLVSGGPAETAGIKVGDVIVSVNGVEITERGSIRDAFDGVSPGDKVTVVVDRDGASQSIVVTTGSQADRPTADEIPYFGARPERPMDGSGPPALFTVGVVDAGSPAEAAGLKVGDIITSVNGTAVSAPRDAMDAVHDLAPGDTVSLGVTRDGTTLTLTVTLGSQADNPDHPRGPHPGGMGRGMRGMQESGSTAGGATAVSNLDSGQDV